MSTRATHLSLTPGPQPRWLARGNVYHMLQPACRTTPTWGAVQHAGRWLVGYWRGGEFVAMVDCPTQRVAEQELAAKEGQP